jgi:hypothetical protein
MSSLKLHHKSKSHVSWVQDNELKQLKMTLTERDNQVVSLKTKLISVIELNSILLKRINISESEGP